MRANAMDVEQRYLTVRQCSRYLGRSEKGIYHLVREGRIPYRKLPGGRLVFDRVAVDRWIAEAPGTSVRDALTELRP